MMGIIFVLAITNGEVYIEKAIEPKEILEIWMGD